MATITDYPMYGPYWSIIPPFQPFQQWPIDWGKPYVWWESGPVITDNKTHDSAPKKRRYRRIK